MKAHLDQTLSEAAHRLGGDYAADIRDYEEIHHHILEMADASAPESSSSSHVASAEPGRPFVETWPGDVTHAGPPQRRPVPLWRQMAEPSHLRASDADRDAVAERLRRAAAEGRLEPEELEERLHTALRARTTVSLNDWSWICRGSRFEGNAGAFARRHPRAAWRRSRCAWRSRSPSSLPRSPSPR